MLEPGLVQNEMAHLQAHFQVRLLREIATCRLANSFVEQA